MRMTNDNDILIVILIVILILILTFIFILIIFMIIIDVIHIIIMETIFMNTENSKTNEPHRFKLDLADKLNLKNPKKNIALKNIVKMYLN